MSDVFDVVVIGAGPAGYPAAIRAGQNKLAVACVDEWKNFDGTYAFGGTCLNAGCIPSKALLESSELFQRAKDEFGVHGIKLGEIKLDLAAMQKRRASIVKTMTNGITALFKANGVVGIQGHGRLLPGNKVLVTGADGSQRTLQAKDIVLASGSTPIRLNTAPHDGRYIVDSWNALEFDAVPARLGVIGEALEHVGKAEAHHRIAADADRGGLAHPRLTEALDHLVRERSAPADDAHRAWRVDVVGDDADLALTGSHDARAVRAEKLMSGADHEVARPDHVVHGNELGDAHGELDPGCGRLHDRVRRECGRHEDARHVGPGCGHRIGNRVKDRNPILVAATLARGNPRNDIGAEGTHLPCVKTPLTPRNSLDEHAAVPIDKHAHDARLVGRA